MKQSTKEAKALEFLAKQFQAADLRVEVPKVEDLPKEEDPDRIRLEGEAVAQFISNPDQFTMRKCGVCSKTFAANRLPVKYCSNDCVAKHLAKIGIHWFPHRPVRDRWGWEVPLIVPSQFLEVLLDTMRESDGRSLLAAPPEVPLSQDQTIPDELLPQLNQDEDEEEASVFDFD